MKDAVKDVIWLDPFWKEDQPNTYSFSFQVNPINSCFKIKSQFHFDIEEHFFWVDFNIAFPVF